MKITFLTSDFFFLFMYNAVLEQGTADSIDEAEILNETVNSNAEKNVEIETKCDIDIDIVRESELKESNEKSTLKSLDGKAEIFGAIPAKRGLKGFFGRLVTWFASIFKFGISFFKKN
jgi:hypothetical protein